jgi:phosphoglycolate phosphatase
MNRYKLVIFDFDGTLADSGLGIAHAVNEFARQRNLPIHSTETILNAVGHGVEELMNNLFKTKQLSTREQFVFIEDFIKVYQQVQTQKTFLYPQVPEILHELHQAGTKLAIVSNKPEKLLLEVIASLNLDKLNWIKIAGAETFAQPKPSAIPLQEVMQMANTEQQQTVMVGDSIADCQAAHNAKIDFIGCLFGIGSTDLMRSYPHEKYIHQFKEIKELL